MFRYRRAFLTIFVVVLCSTLALAQDNTCQLLIEQVLTAISENCANPAINNVCYAHCDVSISGQTDFTTPGQQLAITRPDRIQVGNPNLETNQWGAVVLDVAPRAATH